MDTNQTTITTLLDTLTDLQKWTANAIQYIKRQNHLSANEKAGALKRLEQYKKYLRQGTDFYTAEGEELTEADVKQAIIKHLKGQITLNQCARYYEIPTYDLPDTIKPDINNQGLIYLNVSGDIHVNHVSKGDVLYCAPVKDLADLKKTDLLFLFVRTNKRTPRQTCIGLFSRADGHTLSLRCDKPLVEQRAHFPLSNIVHVYKVITHSRDHK